MARIWRLLENLEFSLSKRDVFRTEEELNVTAQSR